MFQNHKTAGTKQTAPNINTKAEGLKQSSLKNADCSTITKARYNLHQNHKNSAQQHADCKTANRRASPPLSRLNTADIPSDSRSIRKTNKPASSIYPNTTSTTKS